MSQQYTETPISIKCCILVASHISSEKRLQYLFECLESFIKQTVIIPVYLSISFEKEELKRIFMLNYAKTNNSYNSVITIYIQPQKTPQMRHMASIFPLLVHQYKWIMFSDDDDLYEPLRVEVFLKNIHNILLQIPINATAELAGIYEDHVGDDHLRRRHEYWCYCIQTQIFGRFIGTIEKYPDVLDNKCCDVLFAEYLRRLDPHKYFFAYFKDKYYNYRVENNSDSVTGVIQTNQKVIRSAREITTENRQECITELNDYLKSSVSIYLHDTFLYSVVGLDFDGILQREFKSEYAILPEINQDPIQQMRTLHEHLRNVCNLIFDIKVY
jgi:hypothetical protein